MLILGIETSCDDTGIAIIEVSGKKRPVFNILSNVVSSQIKTHAPFGGVVPNLAAREHLKNIEPCLKQAFQEAKVKPKEIDLIATTIGPGLIPSLLIGVNFARTLAYVWKKPIVGVNHIEAHILSSIFNFQFSIFKILFPAITLVVSGGHTQLILMKDIGEYRILGETRDDAAGECFDKVAKLLGLGYPGGPIIAAKAAESRIQNLESRIQLPRPMIKHKNYDFSFSGLKTAVLYATINNKQLTVNKNLISALCREVQQAIIDVLINKTLRAAKEYKAKTVILSGGVAANEELRRQLESRIWNLESRIQFLVPVKNLCTDNGAMIAIAGYFGAKRRPDEYRDKSWQKIKANANLRLAN